MVLSPWRDCGRDPRILLFEPLKLTFNTLFLVWASVNLSIAISYCYCVILENWDTWRDLEQNIVFCITLYKTFSFLCSDLLRDGSNSLPLHAARVHISGMFECWPYPNLTSTCQARKRKHSWVVGSLASFLVFCAGKVFPWNPMLANLAFPSWQG